MPDVASEHGHEHDIAALSSWINESQPADYNQWFNRSRGVSEKTIRENGWHLPGFDIVSLALPMDWEDVCSSSRTWAYNLHTWEFLDPVIAAYIDTKRPDLLQWCIRQAIDWIEYYVYSDQSGEHSMSWYDMSLGLRSPRLMALIRMAIEAECSHDHLTVLLDGAMRHLTEHEMERSFNPRTNHGYYAAVGQTVLGNGLSPLPGMMQLAKQGDERLRLMVNTQFKDDGGHSEHSPEYHRMVLDSFIVGIEQGLIRDPKVIRRIDRAASVLGWMIKPDGRLVQFGDSPERLMTSSHLRFSNNDQTNFLMSRGQIGRANTQTLGIFPESGYAFIRDPQPRSTDDHASSSYLAFSASFHSRAHKHADDLNFVWSDHKQEILIDSGRFGYGDLLPANDPKRLEGYYYCDSERQYVESTVAHNTVAVDGKNHDRRSRPPFGSGLLECSMLPSHYVLQGVSDHVHWLHERRLSMSPSNWLIVEDLVQSRDGLAHDFRSWFNLSAELHIERYDDLTLRVHGGNLKTFLWIRGWGNLELISPVKGQKFPLRGWRSVLDRTFDPVWSTGFSANSSHGELLTVSFNFGDHALEIDPRPYG